MSQLDIEFAGSIPAIYDRYLGPLIFEPYAADLAQRVSGLNPGSVLEIAAGTGVVTRALARVLSATVDIVATDLNQPMLDFAARHFKQARPISWQQANALILPFPDASFDVVVCQFGVMFFPDKAAAHREARRVLKPGGRFIFSVWDCIEENEVPHAVSEGAAGVFPADPPHFLARTPHGYFDKQKIRDEAGQANFSKTNCRPYHSAAALLLIAILRSVSVMELRCATRSKSVIGIGWQKQRTQRRKPSGRGSGPGRSMARYKRTLSRRQNDQHN